MVSGDNGGGCWRACRALQRRRPGPLLSGGGGVGLGVGGWWCGVGPPPPPPQWGRLVQRRPGGGHTPADARKELAWARERGRPSRTKMGKMWNKHCVSVRLCLDPPHPLPPFSDHSSPCAISLLLDLHGDALVAAAALGSRFARCALAVLLFHQTPHPQPSPLLSIWGSRKNHQKGQTQAGRAQELGSPRRPCLC